MTEIKINGKLFCKHTGQWIILENDCFDDINAGNEIEITADDLNIKGDLISLVINPEKYVRLVSVEPMYIEFSIRTKYLENIKFSIGTKLKKHNTYIA